MQAMCVCAHTPPYVFESVSVDGCSEAVVVAASSHLHLILSGFVM